MKLEFVKKERDKLFFVLKDSNSNFANSLRRAMIDSVPVMAIDVVEFSNNTGLLYDEIIAHRLGLIPLSTDLKGYDVKETCSCKGAGCNKCTVQLSLSVEGPCMVLAKDIKSKDPKIKPVYPDMPIVQLLKGQELSFVATASLGLGTTHAKFSPCHVWFTNKPSVSVNNDALTEEIIKQYPSRIVENGKISKKLIEELDLFDAVDGVNDDVVKVEYDATAFLFRVESWGQLSTKELVVASLDALDKKLEALEQEV